VGKEERAPSAGALAIELDQARCSAVSSRRLLGGVTPHSAPLAPQVLAHHWHTRCLKTAPSGATELASYVLVLSSGSRGRDVSRPDF
jgi:hypothetical protein